MTRSILAHTSSSSSTSTSIPFIQVTQMQQQANTITSSNNTTTTTGSSSNNSNNNTTTSNSNTTTANSNNTAQRRHDTVELIVTIAVNIGYAVAVGMLARYMMEKINPFEEKDRPPPQQVLKRLQKILAKRRQQLGTDNVVHVPTLDSYELQMAQVIIDPDDIDASFRDIGGIDDTKREIYELAVMPLVQPELFQGKLVQPVQGILLYGKPGTGKTLMAKALAKEAQAVFIPLQLSKILSKWVGESNKLIAATFSLAHKLEPAVIFIDELDTFLKSNNSDNQYLDTIKSEFLTWWDGITTSTNSRVLVLGATNKPHAIDPAIQRRMPRVFHVPLPDGDGRHAILELFFRDEALTREARDYIPALARTTVGYSGSDLKELCKAAAMIPVQERTAEYARRRVMGEATHVRKGEEVIAPMRPITRHDMEQALLKVGPTGAAAQAYGREMDRQDESINGNSLRHLTALLRSLSNLSTVDENEVPNMPFN